MAGLMGVTAFLSMWINNSAAASIMLPAAMAVADEFENYDKQTKRQQITTNGYLSNGVVISLPAGCKKF